MKTRLLRKIRKDWAIITIPRENKRKLSKLWRYTQDSSYGVSIEYFWLIKQPQIIGYKFAYRNTSHADKGLKFTKKITFCKRIFG